MGHLLNEPVKRMLVFLNSIHPIGEDLTDAIVEAITYLPLKKGEYLLKEGEVCKHVYFVDHGLLRQFYVYEDPNTKEEKDCSKRFIRGNEVCLPSDDFCAQTPSEEYIQALEPSELICIGYEELKRIEATHKKLIIFGRLIATKCLVDLAVKMRDVHLLEPAERIYALRLRDPDLVSRVPEK